MLISIKVLSVQLMAEALIIYFLKCWEQGSTSSGNAFNIAPGNSGAAKWIGTVWAPNGNINLGNSGNMTSIIGGLFTNNTINATVNVTLDYAPYIEVRKMAIH